KGIVDAKIIGDRIISLKFVKKENTFNVISGYAPQVGLDDHWKIKFWKELEDDLNGHVGRDTRGFEGVHGEYEIGESNMEDWTILDFFSAFDFTIVNTCFNKRVSILSHIRVGWRELDETTKSSGYGCKG
ncbi:hypothetical protein Lal_00042698, partial [Lupinus albus]